VSVSVWCSAGVILVEDGGIEVRISLGEMGAFHTYLETKMDLFGLRTSVAGIESVGVIGL